jgi:hypothetical protein
LSKLYEISANTIHHSGLAIQDFGGKTGAFYRDEKEIEWENL